MNEIEVFNEETFEAIFTSAACIGGEIYESATSNIIKAQDKQKKNFDRGHLSNSEVELVDLILYVTTKGKDKREEISELRLGES